MDMPFINAVTGFQEKQITHYERRTGGKIVREDIQFIHHVVAPDNVAISLACFGFFGEGSVIFTIKEAFGVNTDDFTTVGDIVESVAFNVRCGTDSLPGPVVNSP